MPTKSLHSNVMNLDLFLIDILISFIHKFNFVLFFSKLTFLFLLLASYFVWITKYIMTKIIKEHKEITDFNRLRTNYAKWRYESINYFKDLSKTYFLSE